MIVLCELFWTLDRRFRLPREDIVSAVGDLLDSADIRIERAEQVAVALKHYQETNYGFADILVGLVNSEEGCETTLTFDRGQQGLPATTVLSR